MAGDEGPEEGTRAAVARKAHQDQRKASWGVNFPLLLTTQLYCLASTSWMWWVNTVSKYSKWISSSCGELRFIQPFSVGNGVTFAFVILPLPLV